MVNTRPHRPNRRQADTHWKMNSLQACGRPTHIAKVRLVSSDAVAVARCPLLAVSCHTVTIYNGSKSDLHWTHHLPRNCESVSGSVPAAKGSRLIVSHSLEQRLSSCVIFPPLLQARQYPELRGTGALPQLPRCRLGDRAARSRTVWASALDISELIQTDCRLQATGNPLPRG